MKNSNINHWIQFKVWYLNLNGYLPNYNRRSKMHYFIKLENL